MRQSMNEIAEYYADMHLMFRTGGENLHHGIWDENTKNITEANENSNRFVAECLAIEPADTVLDAGCGYGGTSIYLARHHDVRMTGINIVDVQLASAAKYLRNAEKKLKRKLDVTFSNRNYLETGFDNQSFDKICAIESVCYAANKSEFLQEAYRLLRPGGRLVVMDTFRSRASRDAKEQAHHRRFCEAYHAHFGMREGFQKALQDTGFKGIVFHDKYRNFIKTAKLYSRMSFFVLPITWLLHKLRIISPEVHRGMAGLGEIGKLAKSDCYTYGAFVATK